MYDLRYFGCIFTGSCLIHLRRFSQKSHQFASFRWKTRRPIEGGKIILSDASKQQATQAHRTTPSTNTKHQMTKISFIIPLILGSFIAIACAQEAVSQELKIQLKTASTQLERLALLNDSQFVFDFSSFANATKSSSVEGGLTVGQAGQTVAALPTNFPALIGHGMAMTVGYIGPCGINLPHTHPRATEVNFIVSGEFRAGFFLENGARFIGTIAQKFSKIILK